MHYTAQTFSIPALTGISAEQIAEHMKLYNGYVTQLNSIIDTLAAHRDGSAPLAPLAEAEIRRRFAFEFCGMRMHEYYFAQLEGSAKAIPTESRLATLATQKYGSIEGWVAHIKTVASMRGPGWVVVAHDTVLDTLHTVYVDEHHNGHLTDARILCVIDTWEHAYMVDYGATERGKHIEALLANLNWEVIAQRLPEHG